MASSISYNWHRRNGKFTTYKVMLPDSPTPTEAANADAMARSMGWPGHGGGRWNYLKDDFRAWVRKLRGK